MNSESPLLSLYSCGPLVWRNELWWWKRPRSRDRAGPCRRNKPWLRGRPQCWGRRVQLQQWEGLRWEHELRQGSDFQYENCLKNLHIQKELPELKTSAKIRVAQGGGGNVDVMAADTRVRTGLSPKSQKLCKMRG